MKNATVNVRKPSTGTDCRISSAGTMTISARRLFAASVAIRNVNTRDAMIAASIRSVVRSAYSGRRVGSSTTGATVNASSGARMAPAPWIANTARPARRDTATRS